MGKRAKRAGRTLTLGVTAPLTAAGAAAVSLAVSAEETASKFNTVLGPAAAGVDAEIGKMMDTIPATREQLRGAVADMTMLGKAAGLSADEARELSTQFVVAAGDLGSFNEVPIDQALEAIRSGLVGASEPLRQFGIDVREGALETIALEEGLIKSGEEMDASARAAAVFAAIQRDASDAMGDAARTADSTANQLKFMQRDIKELATKIGKDLIPALKPAIEFLASMLERFNKMPDSVRGATIVMGALAAALGPVLSTFGALAPAIANAVRKFGEYTRAANASAIAAESAAANVGALGDSAERSSGKIVPLVGKAGILAAVAAALIEIKRQADGSAGKLETLAASIVNLPVVALGKSIRKNIKFFKELRGETDDLTDSVSDGEREWEDYTRRIQRLPGVGRRVQRILNVLGDELRVNVARGINDVSRRLGNLIPRMDETRDSAAGAEQQIEFVTNALGAFGIEVDSAATETENLANNTSGLRDKAEEAAEQFRQMSKDLEVQRVALEEGEKAARELDLQYQGLTESQAAAIVEQETYIETTMRATEEQEAFAEAVQRQIDANNQATESYQEIIKELDLERAEIENNIPLIEELTEEKRRLELQNQGLTDSQIESILAREEEIESLREHQREVQSARENVQAALEPLFEDLLPSWAEDWGKKFDLINDAVTVWKEGVGRGVSGPGGVIQTFSLLFGNKLPTWLGEWGRFLDFALNDFGDWVSSLSDLAKTIFDIFDWIINGGPNPFGNGGGGGPGGIPTGPGFPGGGGGNPFGNGNPFFPTFQQSPVATLNSLASDLRSTITPNRRVAPSVNRPTPVVVQINSDVNLDGRKVGGMVGKEIVRINRTSGVRL